MTWHKWVVRGMVFTAAAALVGAGTLYALWTNPEAVRRMVQEKLGVRLVGVSVHVESARMRLLGGILVRELRLARREGLERHDFLYIPQAIIFHDKEHLLDGKVQVRKLELNSPHLRLVRRRDGRFNVSGIFGPADHGERMPAVVIRHGTLTVEDRTVGGGPLLEVRNIHLTLVNDPLPTIHIDGSGEIDLLGPVRIRASVPRDSLAAGIELDLPDIPIDPDLIRRAAAYCPAIATHLGRLSGRAEVTGRIQILADGPRRLSYDMTAQLRQGRLEHPALPTVLERIDLKARLVDGVVPQASLTAMAGSAKVSVRVADLKLPADANAAANLDALAGELDVGAEQLSVTADLLARLPDRLRFIQRDYSPRGPVTVRYSYRRNGPRGPRKEWLIRPEGMSGECLWFRYPLDNVRGDIWVDASTPQLDMRIDLVGSGGGHRVAMNGTIKGRAKTSAVALDIHGQNVLLDDRILQALPPAARRVAVEFLPDDSRRLGLNAAPMGRADVHVRLRRAEGQERLERVIAIAFRQTRVKYDLFPQPLKDVSGTLVLYPDHWECKGFRGSHDGGEFHVDGRSYRLPGRGVVQPDGGEGAPPQRVHLRIRGKDVRLGPEFEQALVPGGGKPPGERRTLQAAWRSLALAGRLNFSAEVIDTAGQPQDIDVAVDVRGCTMQPAFFNYALHDVACNVRYVGGRLYLRDFHARHGAARLGMTNGLIQPKPGGGFQAWLRGVHGRGVPADADLQAALPEGLRKALQALRLRSPLDADLALTIDAGGPGTPVKLWWDGGLWLRDAAFRAGVDVTGATGQCSCRGYHDGRALRGAFGDVLLERATLLGQPLTGLHARLEVRPDSPDVLRIRDLKAGLFGGTVAGEARLDLAPVLRYDVLVEAMGVQLAAFGRHNLGPQAKAQLEGPARAALHLMGEGNDLLGLKGNGRVDVVGGKMGQLPVLLDLLKAFGLRMPDRTAFVEAHLVFGIEGPRIDVQQLDLFGKAVNLRGQGAADLDGSNVNLEFTATPGQFSGVLPEALDVLPQLLSQQLFKIKMRGKLGQGGKLRFDKELMPAVVEPIKRAIGG